MCLAQVTKPCQFPSLSLSLCLSLSFPLSIYLPLSFSFCCFVLSFSCQSITRAGFLSLSLSLSLSFTSIGETVGKCNGEYLLFSWPPLPRSAADFFFFSACLKLVNIWLPFNSIAKWSRLSCCEMGGISWNLDGICLISFWNRVFYRWVDDCCFLMKQWSDDFPPFKRVIFIRFLIIAEVSFSRSVNHCIHSLIYIQIYIMAVAIYIYICDILCRIWPLDRVFDMHACTHPINRAGIELIRGSDTTNQEGNRARNS